MLVEKINKLIEEKELYRRGFVPVTPMCKYRSWYNKDDNIVYIGSYTLPEYKDTFDLIQLDWRVTNEE